MILDHTDKIELSTDAVQKHKNEIAALAYLAEGLAFLYEDVKRFETDFVTAIGQGHVTIGNHPELAGVPLRLFSCFFHWYAVSACNYVRLVGWLRHGIDPASPKPLEYLESVLPDVKVYRDKVAAHFARSSESSRSHRDEEAERQASAFPQIGWSNDAFYANLLRLQIVRGGKKSTSEALRPWSLTRVHEQLTARYWPNTQGAS